MQRRTFFKSMALGLAALSTSKLTPLEAKDADDVPAPKPLVGTRAFVTTVKGPVATVKHGLDHPHVFVCAVKMDGQSRMPLVEPIDRNSVKLTFAEPWSILGRRKVYKVVISALTRLPPARVVKW